MRVKSKNKRIVPRAEAPTKKPTAKKPTALATKRQFEPEANSLDFLLNLGSGDHQTSEENLDFLDDKKFEGFDPTGGESIDIVSMVEEAIEQDNLVSPDLKIDDSSCREAPNVLSWLIDDGFLGCETPYLEQALTCIKLFAEFCPNCSNQEWMEIENHEPQEGIGGILSNVQMMEFGVCPECGTHRSDAIASGKLNFYNELAMLAGQRCVTGDTLVLSEQGLKRIDSWDQDRPIGFSPLRVDLHNGTELETTSQFYKSKPEICHLVELDNGIKIKGTKDHPIYVYDRFKTLPHIIEGEWVPVKIGQRLWGKSIINYSDILKNADRLFNEKLEVTISSKKHQLKNTNLKKVKKVDMDLYTLMGLWVSEGRGSGISNMSKDVLSFLSETIHKYINARYVGIDDKGVRVFGYKGQCWYASILGMKSPEELWLGSAKQKIPKTVLEAPEEYVCAFLKGLFEGDGSVRDGRHQIKYYSISSQLIRELQTVLHNLGIACKIKTGYSAATNTKAKRKVKTWTLSISGKYLKVFDERIGFLTRYKQDDLDNHIHSYDSRSVNQTYYYQRLPLPLLSRINLYMESNIRVELNQIKIKSEVVGTSGSKLGLQSIFGRDATELGFSISKKVARGLPLTQEQLKKLCDRILEYRFYFSNETLKEIEYWQTFIDESVYWQQVKKTKVSNTEYSTYDFTLPKTHRFIANGLINHNSGKSIVTAMASTYITHRILKMQKPTDIFRVGKGQILHGTFVALTQGQAKDTLWEPFYGYLLESPWFKKYHSLLRFYERKYKQEFFKLKDTFVLYRHRSLTVYPAGPDKRVLRGRTRIFGAIDEIGWFDNTKNSQKVKINAEEVYVAMVRSLATVRSSEERLVAMKYDMAISGYMLNISSPSSIRDKICELVRSSIGSKKTYGVHAPTWKMNPNITQQSGFLLEEYRKDPVTAQRDYGAEPPLTANPFISNAELVRLALNPNLRNLVKYKPKQLQLGTEKYRYAEIEKIKPGTRPSIMTLDAGLTNNSFALTIGGLNNQGVPQVDLCVEIMPQPGIPLNYSMIYEEVMKPIIEERNVRILCADRWNSVKILQDAEIDFAHKDLIQRQYSLKYHDMWGVKNALEQTLLIIPNLEKGQELDKVLVESLDNYPHCFEGRPVSHLALQILTVTDTGRSVLKGDGELTDDIWRAMCLMYWATQQEEFIEILEREENVERKQVALGYALMGSNAGSKGVTPQARKGSSGMLGLTRQRK